MSLENWRNEIDSIDAEILDLLQKRITIVREIGKVKARAGIPMIDEERERIIINRVLNRRKEPLSVEAVNCVFNCVIQESRRVQIAELIETCQKEEIRR